MESNIEVNSWYYTSIQPMTGIKRDSCDRKQLVKVNVLRKRVNLLRGTRQRFPGDGGNLFRMDQGSHRSQITVIETETETVRLKLIFNDVRFIIMYILLYI